MWRFITIFGTSVSALAILFARPVPVEAAIETLATPPASVVAGQLESNTLIRGFLESQGNLSPTSVNVLATGAAMTINGPEDLVGGTVNGPFDTWFFHVDPVGSSTSPLYRYNGVYTFDTQILGLIVTAASLNSTDSSLGSGVTSYPVSDGLRGLEWNGQDELTISSDGKTLSFALGAANGIDHVRVLTAAVPEPASVAVWSLLGVLGLVTVRLRRNRS